MNLFTVHFDNDHDAIGDSYQVVLIADSKEEALGLAKAAMKAEGYGAYETELKNVEEHDMTKPLVQFTGW